MKISSSIITVLLGCIFSFLILTSCNTNDVNNSIDRINQKQKLNHFLISGNNTILSDAVAEMIKKSDIRGGGYVVIIPTADLKKDDNSQIVKNEFYAQQVMAVHIIKLNPVSEIKNSDIIAIENATIVCLLGDKSYTLKRLVAKAEYRDAFSSAFENGTLIAGIGNATSMICENYLWLIDDPNISTESISLEKGLGLLRNVIIDDTLLLNRNKAAIESQLSDSNFVFVGTNNIATVYINGFYGMVLNKSVVETTTNFKEIKKFEKDQRFSILK